MLHRAGLPEAALDLAGLAGAPHGAAFCHIMEEDGSSGAADAAGRLAERFDLPLVATPDVLDSMLGRQRLVVPAGQQAIETAHGTLEARLFRDPFAGGTHVAVLLGDVAGSEPLPVVVLTQALVADVFGRAPAHRVDTALAALVGEGRGALLYLAPGEPATDLNVEDMASSPHSALLRATRGSHVVTQVLRALGAHSVRRIESR
jgi:3,4-dihydroxy 2-butanone 4-phosphate synthase/GTP cyclohydrolase II